MVDRHCYGRQCNLAWPLGTRIMTQGQVTSTLVTSPVESPDYKLLKQTRVKNIIYFTEIYEQNENCVLIGEVLKRTHLVEYLNLSRLK